MRRGLVTASLVALAFALAGCGGYRTASRAQTPRVPGAVPVRPLDVVALRSPYQALVLAAGGAGRAAPVALAPGGGRRAVARGLWIDVRPVDDHRASRSIRTGPLAAAELAVHGTLALAPGEFVITLAGTSKDARQPGPAQIAVAIFAALVDAPFDATSVVVAELARDGTLAPVDDPVGAVDRALRGGARRIVLPLAGRFARTPDATAVDLLARGRRGGAEVTLAGDLPQAVRALTGFDVPKAHPLRREVMALDDADAAALALAYRSRLVDLSETWPRIVELGVRARSVAPVAANVDAAVRASRRAETLRVGGEIAAAVAMIDRAAFHVDLAVHVDDLVVAAAAEAEGSLQPRLRAALSVQDASASPASSGSFGGALRAVMTARDRARATAWVDLAAGRAAAAVTALAEFERLPVDRRAGRGPTRALAEQIAPVFMAAARARYAARASVALRALDRSDSSVRFDPQRLADLSQLLHERAAAAAALASSPDLDRWTGEPRPHQVRRSEQQALRLADVTARRWAAQALTATGVVPAAARARFQAAVALASGSAGERALALELYRAASADCRVAVLVALAVAPRGPSEAE